MRLKELFEPKPSLRPSKARQLLILLEEAQALYEKRKQLKVSNRESIGIDDPHVPGQQKHGHLENGRAVNQDGSISHGGNPFYLTKAQADALRSIDFKIPRSRLIESEGNQKIKVALDPEIAQLLLDLRKFYGDK